MPPPLPPKKPNLWLQRIWLVVFVLFCLEVGIILTALPWTRAPRSRAADATSASSEEAESLATADLAGGIRVVLPGSGHHPHRAALDPHLDRQLAAAGIPASPGIPHAQFCAWLGQRARPGGHLDGSRRGGPLSRSPLTCSSPLASRFSHPTCISRKCSMD